MSKYLRFDSVGGASGDMILSSLAALGVDMAAVEKALSFFPEPLHFHVDPAADSGLNGLHVSVHSHHHLDEAHWQEEGHSHTGHDEGHAHADHDEGHHHHEHRSLPEILTLLAGSPLPPAVIEQASAVFRELAAAEAQIHGKTPETIHFHEVGAWDSVADVVGSCLALHLLGVEGVSCGPLPCGVGTIHCAHGEMPNPAPATQLLLAGMAVTQTDEPHELVTPTAAAILRVWTKKVVPATVVIERAGIGFGSHPLDHRPDILRATLLSSASAPDVSVGEEPLLVLEANLDDSTPEILGDLLARLLAAGARDAWCTPILMKKGRPATLLSVLCGTSQSASLRELIFRNSTTFGIRWYPIERETLQRRTITATTPWGAVPVKVGTYHGEDITFHPEYDACQALALKSGVPLRAILSSALSVHS